MQSSNDLKGRWAEMIAKQLWPDIELEQPGSRRDMAGCDGRTADGDTIQVKADLESAKYRNLFWEICKRNDGEWNCYGDDGKWHMSPSMAHVYIFVGPQYAYRVPVSELVRVVAEHRIVALRTRTSLGFRVPIYRVNWKLAECRQHSRNDAVAESAQQNEAPQPNVITDPRPSTQAELFHITDQPVDRYAED